MDLNFSAERISRLLELLLQAAADPARWPAFIGALNEELDAEKGALVWHQLAQSSLMRSSQSALLFQAGYSPEAIQVYGQHYGTDDPYARGFRMRHIQHSVGLCFDLVDHDTMRRGTFYNDFARRFDICYLCWIAFTNQAQHTALSLVRSEKREPFGEPQLKILALLAPHLKQAISLNRKLEMLRTESTIWEKTAEAFAVAVISLDANGQVITVSKAAEELLSQRDGIRLQNRKLVLDCHVEHARFEAVLQGAIQTAKGQGLERPVHSPELLRFGKTMRRVPTAPSGGGIQVSRSKQDTSLQLTVFPFRSDSVLQEDRPCALVFLYDPLQRRALHDQFLREIFGLTLAESQLAQLIGTGIELQTAADQLHITKETARDRLKQIFRKTGVSRQPELVHLLSGLPQA